MRAVGRVVSTLGVGLSLAAMPAPVNARQAAAPRPQLMDPSHDTRTPDVPGLTAATSTCGVSDDEAYGTTIEHPIQTGGGDAYMASRQVKYLSALRGPAGQGLHFVREGSLPPLHDADQTILDIYRVEYAGLDKPLKLYIDGYHWSAPVAPKGWLCGAAMNLDPPRADPFLTARHLRELAVTHADAYREPIPFEDQGPRTHGVVFDYVRLLTAFARDAAAKGKTLDPENLPQDLRRQAMVIVATPMECDGHAAKVSSVAAVDANGNQPPIMKRAEGPGDIAALVPGYEAPEGSVAVQYGTQNLISGARMIVRYEGCTLASAAFAAVFRPARFLKTAPAPPLPGMIVGPAGETVTLQLFVLPDGTGQLPAYDGGNWAVREAGVASIPQWTFAPMTINGAPILQAERVNVLVK